VHLACADCQVLAHIPLPNRHTTVVAPVSPHLCMASLQGVWSLAGGGDSHPSQGTAAASGMGTTPGPPGAIPAPSAQAGL